MRVCVCDSALVKITHGWFRLGFKFRVKIRIRIGIRLP